MKMTLSAQAMRVLGCLLEKQAATIRNYLCENVFSILLQNSCKTPAKLLQNPA
ncbi:hypothetical protein IFT95_05635 [Pantoea agglomerans]|uniref:hypothetical protein n=1 Tax=Enterobacter agglomerans TaxID=549 RepID=UPI00178750F1|nr:hypothetical protein [Pantoea agglomerans]MBD8231625.1 hypothetical protein [Pantoea agglomerans]MBD8241681.1 hypothetical protein [Pantoea agglomerans]